MPHFNFVQEAQRAPGVCLCCGTPNGPFIDLSLGLLRVPTDVGLRDVEASAYLCVGVPENPGCAVQIGRLSGLLVDVRKLDELHEHIRKLDEEIVGLHGALAKRKLLVSDLVSAGVVKEVAGSAV